MAKQVLNVGLKNNDKTGDTLRAGGLKIKANFDEIYAALALDSVNISGGNLLKTGDYSDLRNKPDFSNVAISGSFYDLESRPDIGIYVGAPPNDEGVDGHVAANMAFDSQNLYVCLADYEEQAVFGNITFMHEENHVDFPVRAKFTNNDGVIALYTNTYKTPLAGWSISDGTNTVVITQVELQQDINNQPYYLCHLASNFVSVAEQLYSMQYDAPSNSHVICVQWKPEYQALLDAHEQGQGSRLRNVNDQNARVITDLIHDSINNELTIVYLGSQVGNYVGMTIKLDQPKIWKSIPWADFGQQFDARSNILLTASVTGGVDEVSATVLNVNTRVQKLGDGVYRLGNGQEGQVVELVLKSSALNPSAIKVYFDNARVGNTEYQNIFMNPFIGNPAIGIVTLIFTDGAWQSNGGQWD
jgi:hypothetical protein